MSNVEHLFENALLALENDYYFGEWKSIEKDRHNTDGISEEVIEAIWELAIYTKYTYEFKAIPIDGRKKKTLIDRDKFISDMFDLYIKNRWNPRDIHFSLLDVRSNIDSPEYKVKAIPKEWLLNHMKVGNVEQNNAVYDLVKLWEIENDGRNC